MPSDFDTVPFLIVNGDYRADASRIVNRATVAADQLQPDPHGRPGDLCRHRDAQPQKKWRGQTHMNMLGTNNLELFDYFLAWAKTNIDNPKHKGGCADGDDDRDDDVTHHH